MNSKKIFRHLLILTLSFYVLPAQSMEIETTSSEESPLLLIPAYFREYNWQTTDSGLSYKLHNLPEYNKKIAQLFQNHTINPNEKTPQNSCPAFFYLITKFAVRKALEYKKNPVDLALTNNQGQTFLHMMMRRFSSHTIGALEVSLQHMRNTKLLSLVNAQDSEGNTPLHYAILFLDQTLKKRKKALKAIELLLKHGANYHLPNKYNKTPCIMFQEVYKKLIKK